MHATAELCLAAVTGFTCKLAIRAGLVLSGKDQLHLSDSHIEARMKRLFATNLMAIDEYAARAVEIANSNYSVGHRDLGVASSYGDMIDYKITVRASAQSESTFAEAKGETAKSSIFPQACRGEPTFEPKFESHWMFSVRDGNRHVEWFL
jgi:hypothetical protein